MPEAVPIVLGQDSKCTKSPWYDQSLPIISMHQCRDRQVHDKRRRVWSRGFSPSALRDYETRVVKYTQDLLRQISSFSGKPLNASKWFNFLSFDVYAFNPNSYLLSSLDFLLMLLEWVTWRSGRPLTCYRVESAIGLWNFSTKV
jgi:hypothetical protein